MRQKRMQEADSYIARHRRRRIWQRIVGGLACVVVFCTTYALILPAITMENIGCGLAEHTHTEACYTRVTTETSQEPVCSLERLNLHEHTADCFDGNGERVCGYSDFVVHEHNSSCYDENGDLWCPLPEIEAHTHDESCYAQPEGVHTHDDECYIVERGKLICTESEEDTHIHDDSCYDEAGELICGQDESEGHTHSADCYETSRKLTCGLSEDAHQHTDECYEQNKVLTYDLPTEPEEDSDAEPELVCDKEEIVLHTHKDSCFDGNGTLICGKQEVLEHIHSADCFQTVETASASDEDALTCTIPEGDGAHTHSEDCYDEAGELICSLEESGGHRHSALCYGTWELTCGKEEHTHTDACIEAELTAEEQAQVDEVIALIDALSTQEEIEETLTAFDEAGDEDSYDAYLTEVIAQVKEAHEAYEALTEAQKLKVTNAAKLMALEPLWSVQLLPETNTDPKSIYEYAGSKAGASIEITVSDPDTGAVIQPDENGVWHVNERQSYNIRMTFASTSGMEQGTYYFELPEGQTLNSTSGTLMITDRTTNQEIEIGTWSIEMVDGTPRMVFNVSEDIKNYTNITLTAITQVRFQEADEPLNVGSDIKFQVVPTDTQEGNELSKWANEIETVTNEDGTTYQRIQWRTQILVHNGAEIVGKTITDTIEDTSTHYFSSADIAAGLEIEATDPDTGVMHRWTVHAGDEGLTWTESGWTYTIPETVTCERSGDHKTEGPVTLGNRGWKYYFRYTSTVLKDGSEGYVTYKNKAIGPNGEVAEDSEHQGGTTVPDASATKTGSFNEATQSFDWEMNVTIPAAEGEKYIYYWFLSDELSLRDAGDHDITDTADAENKLIYNDALRNATVTAVIDGQTVTIPNAREATASTPYCWEVYSNSTGEGTYQVNIYGHCTCTEATCQVWKNGKCADKGYNGSYGKLNDAFCRCWCATEDVTFTFRYSVEGEQAQKIIAAYGGQGDSLRNKVTLRHKEWDETKNNWSNVTADDDRAHIPIPGTFTKTDTSNKDDKTVTSFEITMNGEKQDLSQADGGTVTIVDTMSQTLLFMPDSLQITAEDRDDKVVTLVKDTDYTVEYNNSGVKNHTVTVKLLHPGAYKYVMTYNAAVYIPTGTTDFTYSNTASVQLFGKNYSDEVQATDTAQTAAGGETYGVTLKKVTDSDQTKTLSGAVFGVYSSGGTKLTEVTTGTDGTVQVQTDTSKGIVFLPHTLYYFQEITPPEGYQLNTQKYWFWFCNQESSGCKDCPKTEEEKTFCLPASGGTVSVSNKQIPTGHELPDTGGAGTTAYATGGLIAVIGAGLLLLYKEKKRRKGESASS